MPTGTLTSKGQVTIPKPIRDFLKLKAGQLLDFQIGEDGRVILRPLNRDVRSLRGLFKVRRGKRATVKGMNEAITDGYADL